MSETSVKGPYPYAKIALAGTAFLILVVVLPSVFLPLIWHLKHQATRVTCQASLKQLGLVSLIYAETHGGQFPTAEQCVGWALAHAGSSDGDRRHGLKPILPTSHDAEETT
jgi:hypothetical protein